MKVSRLFEFIRPYYCLDEEMQRRARVVHYLALSLIFASIIGFLAVVFVFVEKTITTIALAALVAAALTSLALSRKGKIQAASWLLLSALWLLSTGVVSISGGMRSLDIVFYVTGTVLAGLLLGQRGTNIYGGVSLLMGLVFLGIEAAGISLPNLFHFPSQSGWVLLLMNLVILIPVVNITINTLTKAIDEAHQRLEEQKRIQAELRNSEQKFSKAFHASPMAIVLQGTGDRRYIDVNEGFVKITGYSREEAIGKRIDELNLYPDRTTTKLFEQDFLATGSSRDVIFPFRRKNGEIGYGIAWGEQIEIDGEMVYMGGIIDITERKRFEIEQAEHTREILTLYEALSQISGAPENVSTLSKKIAEIIVNAFQAKECAVWLLTEDKTKLVRKAYLGPGNFKENTFPLDRKGLITSCIKLGESIYAPDVRVDPRYYEGDPTIRSEFVVPLIAYGEVLGMINMQSTVLDDFSEQTRRKVLAFAQNAALALQNARLVASLEQNLKDLRETQSRINFFLGHTAEGIYRIDYEPPIPAHLSLEEQLDLSLECGKIGECNDAFAKMYGYQDRQAIIGRPSRQFYSEDSDSDEQTLESDLQFFRDGYTSNDHETEELNANGETVYFLNNLVGIIRDGYFVSTWGTQRDITPLKKALAELAQLNHELEKRVEERTAEFQQVNKELETFAYSISHDLRAPLRALRGFSEILLTDFSEQIDPAGKSFIEKISNAAREMNEKIEGLLVFSRTSRQELTRTKINLSEMALSILDTLRAGNPDRSVTCSVQDGLTAAGDPILIRNVLENLLGNAWKYSSKNPHAIIEFGMRIQDQRQVYFVRDNGAGFDMKYAGNLFGTFHRLHSAAEFEGHGIGLATVQRIINRHNGQIWAEAEKEKGATFYFTL